MDEPHGEGVFRLVAAAGEQKLLGARDADDLDQPAGELGRIGEREAHGGNGEGGVRRREPQVAGERQRDAGAVADTADERDTGLRTGAHRVDGLAHSGFRPAPGVGLAEPADVGARDEGLRSLAGNGEHADRVVAGEGLDGGFQLARHFRADGVVARGIGDDNAPDRAVPRGLDPSRRLAHAPPPCPMVGALVPEVEGNGEGSRRHACPASPDSAATSIPSLRKARVYFVSNSSSKSRLGSAGHDSQPFCWISVSSWPADQPA